MIKIQKSLFYYFEFGPDRLDWGMGIWGENRELMDLFRKKIRANPASVLAVLDKLDLYRRKLYLGGSIFKRMDIPSDVPETLKRWYVCREMYIGKDHPPWQWAFSDRAIKEVRKDFISLAPLYQMIRGYLDQIPEANEHSEQAYGK